MISEPDRELLMRIQAGRDAFDTVCVKYSDRLVRTLTKHRWRWHDVEDATQYALMKVWLGCPKQGPLDKFLLTVASNFLKSRRRKRREISLSAVSSRDEGESAYEAADRSPSTDDDGRDILWALQELIEQFEKLNVEGRLKNKKYVELIELGVEAVRLRAQGWTLAEIAAKQQVNPSTVCARIGRIGERIYRLLQN